MLDVRTQYPDRSEIYQQRFDQLIRARLRNLIDDDLIAEYRSNPHGPHGDRLSRVLNYFRRDTIRGKYALLALKPFSKFQIIRLTGDRDLVPEPVSDHIYMDEAEADFAIFMLRVEEVRNPS